MNSKRKDIINFLVGIGILISINSIGSYLFHRFDLTSENRYSISEPTKKLLSSLEDQVYITVYLEGDFPASFKRLRNETKEMLDEFQAYADGRLEFKFINPSENPNIKERDRVYRNLYEKGLRPTDLQIKDDDGVSKKVVWPGAIASYQGIETPIQLLKSNMGAAPEVVLNQSIESLEYEIANSIKKITTPFVEKIAFIEGHGELNKYETADIVGSLREFYDVERIRIDGKVDALTGRRLLDSNNAQVGIKYSAIIIADPDSAFTEKDKFLIDQYVMYGGKVIWLVEHIDVSMDSLRNKNTTYALPRPLNIEDQLFRYGVRINTDLIQDLRAAPIPVVSGQYGNQVQTQLFPWLYFPLLASKNDHPINKNLDVTKLHFASSIDLVGNNDLKKTVLLSSSKTSKIVKTPTRVSLNMLSYEPPVEQFQKQNVPVAVLVEGQFSSLYQNRLTSQIINSGLIKVKDISDSTQMLFISDGDFIRNDFKQSTNEYFALGFDKYTKQIYANKPFFINAINYMLDDSGLILSNTKSFKIRLLNTQKIKKNKEYIQIINMALPILLIMLIGLILFIIRKRKYTGFNA